MSHLFPSQIRAARALLDLSQEALAAAAGVSVSTVKDFEAGRRDPAPESIGAMQKTLVQSGVTFVPLDGEGGPGVRLDSDVPRIVKRPAGVSFESDNLPFRVRWRGVEVHVFLPKTVLDDLDRTNHRSDAAYLEAFRKREALILQQVAYAIYGGGRVDQQSRLHLRSRDFFPR